MYFYCVWDYSPYTLLHAIPPPWGSHLSLPPKARHAKKKSKLLHETHRRNSVKENGEQKKNPTLHPFLPWTVAVVMSFSRLKDTEIGLG